MKYLVHEGALFRFTDGAWTLEIYRGGGKWERWGDPKEYLFGTPVTEVEAGKWMKTLDQ